MPTFIAHFMAHYYVKFIPPPSISSTHCDPKFSWIWHTIQTVYVIQPVYLFRIQQKYCGFFTKNLSLKQKKVYMKQRTVLK